MWHWQTQLIRHQRKEQNNVVLVREDDHFMIETGIEMLIWQTVFSLRITPRIPHFDNRTYIFYVLHTI